MYVCAARRRSRPRATHEAPLYPRARFYVFEGQKHVMDVHTQVLHDEERRAGAESATRATVLPGGAPRGCALPARSTERR